MAGCKKRVENQLYLDVRELKRQGAFKESGLVVACGTKRRMYASLFAKVREPGVLCLSYSFSLKGEASEKRECRIKLDNSACHFGGVRLWFFCPDCNRRVAIVYLKKETGLFCCRKCNQLNYASQQMGEVDWRIEQVSRLRAELNFSQNMFQPMPGCLVKPRYMRYERFFGLLGRLLVLERRILDDLDRGLSQMQRGGF